MKLPLWCYNCDMLVGHEAIIPFKAECIRCGTVRRLPILRWIVLCILIGLVIALPLYGIYMWEIGQRI
jgi:hypothetical protein